MNYYDEEIKIDGSEPIKLERVQSASKGSRRTSSALSSAAARRSIRPKPDGLPRSSSTTTNEDDEHLDGAKGLDESDASDSESADDSKEFRENQQLGTRLISPSSWDNLSLPQDIKEIFPYIVKYTPQLIETEYHLQPFVPEYVPAVGDVDAFLRVSFPAVIDKRREQDVQEHLQKMGLNFLDEPSGQQSEPSLLSIKLGSVLTGSAKSHSASQVPVAKSVRDVDKWIKEVEHIHLGQSGFDVQPEKDMETMMIDWPQSYATMQTELSTAYNDENLSLVDYIRVLCEKLDIDCGAPGELTQAQCIQKVYTLFSMYLAANHSYE